MDIHANLSHLVGHVVQGIVRPLKSLLEGLINLLPKSIHLSLIDFLVLSPRFLLLLKVSQSLINTGLHIFRISSSLLSRIFLSSREDSILAILTAREEGYP